MTQMIVMQSVNIHRAGKGIIRLMPGKRGRPTSYDFTDAEITQIRSRNPKALRSIANLNAFADASAKGGAQALAAGPEGQSDPGVTDPDAQPGNAKAGTMEHTGAEEEDPTEGL